MDLWEAETLEQVMPGRTCPLALRCTRSIPASEASGEEEGTAQSKPETRVLIVKSAGHPEVTANSLFCELFGNLLARELGIQTPEPALVNLSDELVDQLRSRVSPYNIRLETGLGVGCEYIKGGLVSPVPLVDLWGEELIQAARLYAFDLLTQNPDRRPEKPNCAVLAGRLIAYDFEMAFSFIYMLGKQPAPWRVSKHAIAQNHLFYSRLKRQARDVDWSPLIDSLRALSPQRLDELIDDVPADWRHHAARVRKHILDVRKKLPQFQLELARSLL